MTVLRAGKATDVGQVRPENQDAVLADVNLFAVADGMGGHAGGEIASATAVETLEGSLSTISTPSGLLDALRAANRIIAEKSAEDPTLAGMGTTAVVATLVGTESGDVLLVANVGDSRAYHFHSGELTQVTKDHSLAAELLREGSITEEEAAAHPQRHVITRALGTAAEIDVDFFELRLAYGDRVVLCSDGLTNEISDEEIIRVLRTVTDPTEAAEDMVRRANAHGGHDNISVVVIDALVAEPEDEAPAPAATASISPPPEAPEHEGWLARRRRLGVPRALTARVIGFAVLVIALLAGSWYFLKWYANSSYYVVSRGSQIVVYQGQPGGLLWFQPRLVEVTNTSMDQVLPIRKPILVSGVVEPSLSAANNYVANLAEEFTSTSTSPTTTTVPGAGGVTTPTLAGG